MKKVIWKFEIYPEALTEIPQGSTILSVAAQDNKICIWAAVNPDAPRVSRDIRIYGTGQDIPSWPGAFVGTVLLHGGGIVLHVFDAGEP